MTDKVNTGVTGLELMRKPFPENQISKMCRPYKKDNPKGNCPKCRGYHGLPAIQLSYVGHAALTDRLLDADPEWKWEPLALAPDGTPFLDGNGGMWIKLTVAGVTRLGYGDAQGKTGGDAMKERIGDALRNAAMRFGAALDLWHKGDLHGPDEEETFTKQPDGSFKKDEPKWQPENKAPKVDMETVQPRAGLGKTATQTNEAVARKAKGLKPATSSQKEDKRTKFDFGANVPSPAQEKAQPANQPAAPSSNAVTPDNPITDADVVFPGDENKDRECTNSERKEFAARLMTIRNKGNDGSAMRTWLLKQAGKDNSNQIPFNQFGSLVKQLEDADISGNLKELIK